jgi:hypothetical protein
MKNVIKLFSVLFLVVGAVFYSCKPEVKEPIKVSDVKISKSSLTLEKGDTETLTVTVIPDGAAEKAVTWESNNDDVVSVDNNGNIKAEDVGKAKITVKTKDGNFSASCNVEVVPKIENNYDVTATCEFNVSGMWYSSGVGFPVGVPESGYSGSYNFSGDFRASIKNVSGKTIPAGTPIKCYMSLNDSPIELQGANVPTTLLIETTLISALDANATLVILQTDGFVINSETSKWGSNTNSICLVVQKVGKVERSMPIKGCATYGVKQ